MDATPLNTFITIKGLKLEFVCVILYETIYLLLVWDPFIVIKVFKGVASIEVTEVTKKWINTTVVGLPGPVKFYHWPGMLKYKNKMAI
jgi:hypothetical protein